MGRTTGAPLLFQRTSFLGGPRLAPRSRPPPPSPKKPGRYGARCDGNNTNRLGPRPGPPYGGHGLKLFSLSGRFVRVCKTVAKLLAAHSSWSSRDALVCKNSTGSERRALFFLHSIRYARNDTREKSRIWTSKSSSSCTSLSYAGRIGGQCNGGECRPSY